jgi:hypothetical protein
MQTRRLALGSAALTFVFVLTYNALLYSMPDPGAVGALYVFILLLLWSVSKLVARQRRRS